MWQVGPSHIDVYLKHLDDIQGTPLDEPNLNFTDTPIPYVPIPLSPSAARWNLSSLSNTTYHAAYHSIEDIGNFVKELLDLYPNQVELVPIGHSAQHREMFALEITKSKTLQRHATSAPRKKNGFVIAGAQHAREVRTGATSWPRTFDSRCRSSGLRRLPPCSLPTLCLRTAQSRTHYLHF